MTTTARPVSELRISSSFLWKLAGGFTGLIVMFVLAALLFPNQVFGLALSVISDNEGDADEITDGAMPGVTRMVDADGNDIAEFYDQRRRPVPLDQINPAMVDATVAIEDRRFFEHEGVDWRAVGRAAVGELVGDSSAGGASTLTQQYVRNYLWLVAADDEADARDATERSYGRKMREMELAREVDSTLGKDEIITRYLNLVSFGNGAYGVEEAARTYFGIPASELSTTQAAMLAGLIQSPEGANPYTDPHAATDRRNTVLDYMEEQGKLGAGEAQRLRDEPLGVLPEPQLSDSGCVAAGGRGHFCAYAVDWLEDAGISPQSIPGGVIHTTLDPAAQDAAEAAMSGLVAPSNPEAAGVLNLVEPADNQRPVRAMAASLPYGLDGEAGQTTLALTHSPVGAGAGSVNKVFAATAALEAGWGTDTVVDVPKTYAAHGLGASGTAGCPADAYCVSNAADYPKSMTMTEALATSPNTPFVQMAERVGNAAVVDMAAKLGLSSLTEGDEPPRDRLVGNGSFVLGPEPVNPLELSNVAATLADGGVRCNPTPVIDVTTANPDEHLQLPGPDCEQAVSQEVAAAMSNALSQDIASGTAENAAQAAGWPEGAALSSKTGTTDSSLSAAFMGYTQGLAGASYLFGAGETATPLCSHPVRTCEDGDLYGGNEPAELFMQAAGPLTGDRYPAGLPPMPDNLRAGSAGQAQQAVGLDEDGARQWLEGLGFTVDDGTDTTEGSHPGRVAELKFPAGQQPGATVRLVVEKKPAPNPSSTRRTSSSEAASPSRGRGSSARPVKPRESEEPQDTRDSRRGGADDGDGHITLEDLVN